MAALIEFKVTILFSVCDTFAFIVMMNASNLVRHVGKHAVAINRCRIKKVNVKQTRQAEHTPENSLLGICLNTSFILEVV